MATDRNRWKDRPAVVGIALVASIIAFLVATLPYFTGKESLPALLQALGGSEGQEATGVYPRFEGLSHDGLPLNPASVSGSTLAQCVRDRRTGLVWESKTLDGGRRDARWKYTWYLPDSEINGGDPGAQDGAYTRCAVLERCSTYEYVRMINAEGLCGFFDWRLPTIDMLETLVNREAEGGVFAFLDFFPNTKGVYWSASVPTDAPEAALVLDFYDGFGHDDAKSTGYHIRIVRGVGDLRKTDHVEMQPIQEIVRKGSGQ